MRSCWLGNPIAISGESNVYISNGWGGASMYDAGSRLRWYIQPAAAGHSIALMREAIRRHEHAIKTTQPFERVRPSSTPDCADGIRG